MRHIIILMFTLLKLTYGCQAQDDELNGLLVKLPVAKEDTSKIKLLLQIQDQYLDADNDSALYYNKTAEVLINKLHAKIFRYQCYHAFVKIYHAKFDNENAVHYCLKAIDVAAKNKDDFQRANSFRALFSLYFNLGKKDSAIKYSAYAMELTEKIRDTNNIATMYGNLCRIYNELELHDKAVEFGKKGIELGERYKDYKGMLISMNNLGNSYIGTDNNAALKIFERQLIAGKQHKRIRSVSNALINLGIIYYNLGDAGNVDRIAKLMKEMESQFDEADLSGTSYRFLIYGHDHTLHGRYAQAEENYLSGLKIAQNDTITGPMQNLFLALSALKYAQQDFAAGSIYDTRWDSLNESMRKKEMAEYAMDLEAKYQTERKEAKISLQAAQLKQQSIINYILFIGVASLLIISILLFINYRNKQKLQQQHIKKLETQQQLTATEAVLKGEEQERSRIAKDLHDGLGGMLSGIKYSFSNMKGNLVMTPENAQAFERSMDMLDSSIREMRRVAHNMMPEALVKFGLDTALKDFCNDINQTGALKVSYQSFGMEDAVMEQTTAITIYRIVQELINNTMKHADARTAVVQVTKTGNRISITTEDDGKGFDTAILNQAKGIGWSNIQNRVDFLKADLDVRSDKDKGTSVHIELNI